MIAAIGTAAEGAAIDAAVPLLETRALTVRIGTGVGAVTAVDGLSYRVASGRTLAIVGESGAGKTLGCLALVGLVPRSAIVSGSVRFAGRELVGLDETELRRHRGRDIAIVLQDAARALNPTMTVGEQIAEAARLHERLGRRASHTRAAELLGLLGLREPVLTASAYPHELSGGMRQRALLAIALAAGPRLLIADEITRSLDPLTRARMLELLVSLKDRLGMTLILVSHDLGLVTRVADEILVMRAGRAVEHAPAARLTGGARTAYARALVAAMPRLCAAARPSAPEERVSARRDDALAASARGVLLEARGIVQVFPRRGRGGAFRALDGVSLSIRAGEALGLVGESGAGKSTFARALLQHPRPTAGRVVFEGVELTRLAGRPLAEHRRRMPMVFQEPFASLDPQWRVRAIVEEPLVVAGADRAERARRAADALERVGLPPRAFGRRRPAELSGGQCQRVAIARALVSDPALVILDEAVASLDVRSQRDVLGLLRALRADLGLAFLFISHDLAVVREISDRVAVLYRGRVCEVGPVEAVYRRPAHPYTGALLAAARDAGAIRARIARSGSAAVAPADGDACADRMGCAFRPRCARASPRCAVERPELRSAEEAGHFVACHHPST